MKRSILPSAQDLASQFSYDPVSGVLSRKSDGHIPKCRGKYVRVEVAGKCVLAHRVIWKMVKGDEPFIVDHIDGDGRNNKLCNLRAATQAENLRNRGAPSHNSSGVKGVSFEAATGSWRAQITVNYKAINLGRYPTIEQAAQARIAAAERLHGEFARTN